MMGEADGVQVLIRNIYIIILAYFLLGGIGFYVINRSKSRQEARKSYTKFFTYFLIINILFFSMVIRPVLFSYLAALIIMMGVFELTRLFLQSKYLHGLFYTLSMIVFLVISYGFYRYSILPFQLILYAFLIASIFDSFSQITGQLWGKKKILPRISPNKTVGGVSGGALIALISGYLLGGLYEMTWSDRFLLTTGIITSAFLGDAIASLYKRKYGVKDYSRLIPGHGGFLDRFDSLITCGAWVAFYYYFVV